MVGSHHMGTPVLYGPSTVAVGPANLTSDYRPNGAGLSRAATSGNTATSNHGLLHAWLAANSDKLLNAVFGLVTAIRQPLGWSYATKNKRKTQR